MPKKEIVDIPSFTNFHLRVLFGLLFLLKKEIKHVGMGLAIRSEEEANDPPKVQKQHPNKRQTTIDTKKHT